MVKVEKKKEKSKEFWYLGNSYELIYDDTAQEIEFCDGKLIAKFNITSIFLHLTYYILILKIKKVKLPFLYIQNLHYYIFTIHIIPLIGF